MQDKTQINLIKNEHKTSTICKRSHIKPLLTTSQLNTRVLDWNEMAHQLGEGNKIGGRGRQL